MNLSSQSVERSEGFWGLGKVLIRLKRGNALTRMVKRRQAMEGCVIMVGLIGIQFVYAANSIFLAYLMSMGINPLSFIIFTALSTFIILTPLCVCFERTKWPKQLNLSLMTRLLLISFGGVTVFQLLFLKGIQFTSPTMGTAMPNLAPALIFVIAWALKLESVKLSCIYSKVKIVGTVLCVIGAIAMSILQSTTTKQSGVISSSSPPILLDKEKIIGSMYLIAAVMILSVNIVLQATTLAEFPAPMSLCAITSLTGALITAIIELIRDQKFEYEWPIVRFRDMFGYSLLGGSVTGVCISFNGWALKKRGPVLVSMFSPLGTVCSLLLSVITLGEPINVASVVSMCVVFLGLYLVLWAKGKEGHCSTGIDVENKYDDYEKPLLSS